MFLQFFIIEIQQKYKIKFVKIIFCIRSPVFFIFTAAKVNDIHEINKTHILLQNQYDGRASQYKNKVK